MRQGILAAWALSGPKRKGKEVAKEDAAWIAAKWICAGS
jgi:hypothetical protein